MERDGLFFAVVVGVLAGAVWLPTFLLAQGQEGPGGAAAAAGASNSSLRCPPGMALIEGHKTSADKLIEPFCIDILEYPNQVGTIPAHGVTWIEAQAMCIKEGKRLCKPIEWEAACSGPLMSLYPYGKNYEPERCNTEGEWIMNGEKVVASGAFPGCISGYKVLDMSGNVSEWTDAEGVDVARVYGGSFLSHRYSTCKSYYSLAKNRRYTFNGVRCCVTPQVERTQPSAD